MARIIKRKQRAPVSSSTSSLSSIPKRRKKRKLKVSSSGTSSSSPNRSIVTRAKAKKKKLKTRRRLQIDLQDNQPDPPNRESPSASPLSSPPPSSSRSSANRREQGNAAQRQRRQVAIQRQQPRRFPPNPSQADMDEWLQTNTVNPWVKLSRKHIKRMRPTANIYLKQANFNPATNRITRLLPGGTLARNEYPEYIMLTPINAPKRFSVQLNKNHLYIRKLQKNKITDEYEKSKLWDAVQEQVSAEASS